MKILLLLLTSFCSLSAMAGSFSVGELSAKWNKLAVTVCWLDDEALNRAEYAEGTLRRIGNTSSFIKAPDDLKANIKSLVNSEYTIDKTGIHFAGWESCKDTPSYDVQILVVNDKMIAGGTASLGRLADLNKDYALVNEHQKGFVRLNLYDTPKLKITSVESVLSTALHEFGHLAGLRHEHVQSPSIICNLNFERPGTKTSTFSAYDPSSLMDYCLISLVEIHLGKNFYVTTGTVTSLPKSLPSIAYDKVKKYTDETIFTKTQVNENLMEYKVRTGLSKGDVHGLRCMYVYGPEEFAEKCHKGYIP